MAKAANLISTQCNILDIGIIYYNMHVLCFVMIHENGRKAEA